MLLTASVAQQPSPIDKQQEHMGEESRRLGEATINIYVLSHFCKNICIKGSVAPFATSERAH